MKFSYNNYSDNNAVSSKNLTNIWTNLKFVHLLYVQRNIYIDESDVGKGERKKVSRREK